MVTAVAITPAAPVPRIVARPVVAEKIPCAVPASPAGARAATKTLAAHQMQVLLSAGDPDATRAAPVWRAVGPAA